MKRRSERVSIPGTHGKLAAIVELPADKPKAFGIFSHCFSCTKDLKAIVKISRGLAEQGYGVVRFDFAGLGQSEGSFSDTTFLDNLEDVRTVVRFVMENYQPPRFLMGHSLGGSAMLATAMEFHFVEAISVIASPTDTRHLADTIYRLNPMVEESGEGMVNTGTYEYLIKKPTVDVLRSYDLPERLAKLEKRVFAFHSPADKTLGYHHAEMLASQTPGPVSVANLESANHLLTDNSLDAIYVSSLLVNWFDRFLKDDSPAA